MVRERVRVILVTRNFVQTGGEVPEDLSNAFYAPHFTRRKLKSMRPQASFWHVPIVPNSLITTSPKLAPVLEQPAKDFHGVTDPCEFLVRQELEL